MEDEHENLLKVLYGGRMTCMDTVVNLFRLETVKALDVHRPTTNTSKIWD